MQPITSPADAIQNKTNREAPATDAITRAPFPGSHRIYIQGSDNGIQVPMREIIQSPSRLVNAVAGSTDSAAPMVKVTEPFSVTETQVKTLKAGDGPVVAPTATVSVCYMGVDGRDGHVFDSSYERGAPVDFPLDGVVPGFQKAIAGQKVGSTVAVAMTSADGYPNGQPRAGIEPGDTLVFAIKILDAS